VIAASAYRAKWWPGIGDEADTVSSNIAQDNTLSIGGGATCADLLFERTVNNLIMRVVASDQIMFTNYYSGTNRSIDTPQIVIEGASDYEASSVDALPNKRIESFDFDRLVAAFDTARANDELGADQSAPGQHLGGSEFGGAGRRPGVRIHSLWVSLGLSYLPASAVLAAGSYEQRAQLLQGSAGMQDASPCLSSPGSKDCSNDFLLRF
jgi:hypothetical protein